MPDTRMPWDDIGGPVQEAEPPKRRMLTAHEWFTPGGNGRRFVVQHKHEVRFCETRGGWYVWDGRRWQRDASGLIECLAKQTIASLYADAARAEDSDARREIGRWAMKSDSAAGVRDMLFMAHSDQSISVGPDGWDGNPWILNCMNGTVDLRTGALGEHRREDLCTKLANVNYDPDATLPLWDEFLAVTTKGDKALESFLQRIAGYSLTGVTSEEKLFFVHGPASTGKSTFIQALQAALGDSAVTADFETFLQRQSGGVRNDIARLAGARLVTSIEVDKGKRLAEGLVKTITGGDTVAARYLYHESFEFRPIFKLWLIANDAPRARDDDSALWRRILRVPFEHIITERNAEVKRILGDATLAGAAVLAWAVRGCLDWQRDGLGVPDMVTNATEEYRLSNDPLGDFWAEYCEFAPLHQERSGVLWGAYTAWAKEGGERFPVNRREFAHRLEAQGCKPWSGSGNVRIWRGVQLRAKPSLLEEAEPEMRQDPF